MRSPHLLSIFSVMSERTDGGRGVEPVQTFSDKDRVNFFCDFVRTSFLGGS